MRINQQWKCFQANGLHTVTLPHPFPSLLFFLCALQTIPEDSHSKCCLGAIQPGAKDSCTHSLPPNVKLTQSIRRGLAPYSILNHSLSWPLSTIVSYLRVKGHKCPLAWQSGFLSTHQKRATFSGCWFHRYPLEGGLEILRYICWGFKNKNWLGLAQWEKELANKPGELSTVLEPR